MGDAFVRANINSFGGMLKSQITAYGNITKNDVWETEACYDGNDPYPFPALFNCRNSYLGTRYGAEYQGDLNIGPFGSLIFGARSETETASETEDPNPNDGSFTPVSAQQTTNSVYAEHRINLFQRLDVTLGGRIDAVENGRTFETWRATAAYHIDETGTKLRASAGTGARNASLYQRFSIYGTTDLAPEQSLGFDAGVDQKLFGDRLTASATVFATKFSNLIAYGDVSSCTTGADGGVSSAATTMSAAPRCRGSNFPPMRCSRRAFCAPGRATPTPTRAISARRARAISTPACNCIASRATRARSR